METTPTSSPKNTVLVIGGGFAGVAACMGLRQYHRDVPITLVEPREYTQTAWAAGRALFDPKVAAKSLSPLAPFCDHYDITHLQTTVTELTKDKAVLANGTTIDDFNVCVIATGASTKWPGLGRGLDPAATADDGSSSTTTTTTTIAGKKKHFQETGAALLRAQSVLIVGGGFVGSELAGEIAYYCRHQKNKSNNTTVTLVHAGEHLCRPDVSVKASKMIQSHLEKMGVRVVLNERANSSANDAGGVVWKLQSSGEVFAEADTLVVQTVGLIPCNSFVKIDGALDERGFLQSDDYFRVANTNGKIFALGDCSGTMPNTGAQILQNIQVIGHNVHTKLQSMETREAVEFDDVCYKKYQLSPKVIIVTTGPKSGVFDSPWLTTRRFFPSFKNNTWFLFRLKDLGLKPGSL